MNQLDFKGRTAVVTGGMIGIGAAIVKRLEGMVESGAQGGKVEEYAELLYGYAVLAEGSELPNPAAFARRIADWMSERPD